MSEFNCYFTQIGPKLAESISCTSTNNFTQYLTNKTNTVFRFTEVQEISISKIIHNLSNKNSHGITSELIKSIEPEIVKPLIVLINQVLNTGKFPDKLKIAKVIPIYKQNDPTSFSNFRPISLLPVISKVIAKNMYNQLLTYFTNTNLLSDNQYGFRPHNSTEYAALEMVDRINTQMDQNQLPISIFLLSKAFDTLDHSNLLEKLKYKYYGLETTSIHIII